MERDEGTWITEEMQSAYQTLHEQGLAHAISCYLGQELVGGLYGVEWGPYFAGESMFSRESNASKIAFAFLMKVCRLRGIDWVDCQLPNPHLMSLGAVEMPRQAFINLLHKRRDSPIRSRICVVSSPTMNVTTYWLIPQYHERHPSFPNP